MTLRPLTREEGDSVELSTVRNKLSALDKGVFGTEEEEVLFISVKFGEFRAELAACPGCTLPSPYDSWGRKVGRVRFNRQVEQGVVNVAANLWKMYAISMSSFQAFYTSDMKCTYQCLGPRLGRKRQGAKNDECKSRAAPDPPSPPRDTRGSLAPD